MFKIVKNFIFGLIFWGGFLYFLTSDYFTQYIKTPAPRPIVKKIEEQPVRMNLGEVRIIQSSNGHYETDALVNYAPVRFLIDTGASHIALTYDDAKNIGIDMEMLDFDGSMQTAGGVVKVAIVRLKSVSVQHIEFKNLSASVFKKGDLPISLIGMSFLNRLASFKFENSLLIMEQK